MKFLIPTDPEDTEVLLVKLALESQEHQVRLLFAADLPKLQTNSQLITHTGYHWKSSDRYEFSTDHIYDVVWARRICRSYLPRDLTEPSNYSFVVQENQLFKESILHNLAASAWWVNPHFSTQYAQSIILQLNVARDCGMIIPLTLCSNDPLDIRHFLLFHEKKGVVYKSLCSDARLTRQVTFLSLPRNKVLQSTPGLYQVTPEKKYDLRILCFGDEIVAIQLNNLEEIKIPAILNAQLRVFMRKLNIVFGSFDFIMTPDNQFVFIEMNTQCKFLWIEEQNHHIQLLDRFVQFLNSRKSSFQWNENQFQHSVEQYQSQIEPILTENMRRHVDLQSVNEC